MAQIFKGSAKDAGALLVTPVKWAIGILALPFKAAAAVFNWAAHTPPGRFIVSGAIMLGAGVGIKSWFDGYQKREQAQDASNLREAAALQQSLNEKRVAMAEVSALAGQANPASNNFAARLGKGPAVAQRQAATPAPAPVADTPLPIKMPDEAQLALMASGGRNQ